MQTEQVKISVSDWIKIKDNPQQRDTVAHARKAQKNHLIEYCETHSRVAAAELPSGTRYKLDGHTRSYLWEHELLDKPEMLICDIYHVKDREQAVKLYEHFDNSSAVDTAGDKLSSALNYHKVSIVSPLWKNSGVNTALKALYTDRTNGIAKVDVKDAMRPFVKALNFIDTCGFRHTEFPAPVFCAMLLTVVRDGNGALSFWEAYAKDEGKKTPKNMDAVYACTQKIRDLRDNLEFVRGSRRACFLVVPKLLPIYEKWNGKLFSRYPKPEGDYKHYVLKYCHEIMGELDWRKTLL